MKEGATLSLPKGWEIKKLGDIGRVSMCKRILKKQTLPQGDIPFYKIGTFGKTANAFISKEVYEEYRSKYSYPKIGDILLSASGTIGRRVIYDGQPAYFQDSNIVWIDNDERQILNIFLYKFYGYCDWNPTKGATISRLYNDDLRRIEIPVPPLPEQQRIVSLLDRAFAAIDQAKSNAEKNLQNAKELFESYLQGVFEKRGNDWVNSTIGETCKLMTGGTPSTSKKEYYNGGTIKWLVSGDINQKEIFDCEGRITELGLENSNARFLPVNSVLIALNGQGKTRGTVAMLRTKATCNQSLVSIYPNDVTKVLPELIYANLDGRYNEIRKLTGDSGNDRRGLNMPIIRSISFTYPKSLNEQQTIVHQLDALWTETQKLEAVYQKKIAALDELKKSILQKAFAGELTSSASISVPVAKVIQLQKVNGISPTDLQAGITALALQKHIQQGQERTFGHVKSEKIVHLSEYILNIDLERNPIKDVAGPNDFNRLKKVESRAKKAGYYTVYKNGDNYDYKQGNNFDKVIQKAENSLGETADTLSQIIDILVTMKTQQAEIVATIYAAWNNLIINGNHFSDEDIVTEARENWHEKKLGIERNRFFKALEWMKKNELFIPKGNGKVVETKPNKKK